MNDAELEELLKGKDINLLTTEDKAALLEGRVQDLSYETKQYLLDDFDTGQVLSHQAERAATSTGRGILALRGIETEEDAEKERVSRMMMDTDPVKSGVAMLGGAIVDPVALPGAALAPIKLGTAARTMGARGAVAGAVYGAVEPVYEEYGDSRVVNTFVGLGFGGALGGIVGKLFGKLSPNPAKLKQAEEVATETVIRQEKDAEIALDNAAQTINANDMQQGVVSQTIRNNNTNPAELRFDPNTGTINHVRVDTTPVDFDSLPPGLANLRQGFGGSTIQWASKIDAALHKIARQPKSNEALALRNWLKSKDPNLTDEDIDRLAKDAFKSHMETLPNSTVKGKVVYAEQSPVAKGIYDTAQRPKETVEPYIPQGKIRLDDVFSQDDLQVMEQALGLRSVGYSWKDLTTGRWVSKQEVLWRMEQLGIEPPPATARQAKIDEVPVPTETPGMPKTLGSVGSRGVRPEDVYAEELGGKLYNDLRKGKITEEEIGRRIAAGEGDLRDRELLRNKTSGKQRWMKFRGVNIVNKALQEKGYNDIVQYFLDLQKQGKWLSPEEMSMFTQTGYKDYIAFQRATVIDSITDMVNSGRSLDSQEYMNLINDLFYYSGIHTFFKNQGTYSSRMLYAFRGNTAKIKAGHPMKSVFPTVRC